MHGFTGIRDFYPGGPVKGSYDEERNRLRSPPYCMSAPALRRRLRPRLRLGGASNTDEANPGESPIACVLNRLCELSGKLSLSLWNCGRKARECGQAGGSA